MQPYRCGCAADGSARCKAHRFSRCHTRTLPSANAPSECPPCRNARWGSVNADLALTTLGRARLRDGNAPAPDHVRLADKDEFPSFLSDHNPVRTGRT